MSARGTESKFSNESEMLEKMMQKPRQTVVASLLAYAAVIAYRCPCRKTISCHLKPFFGAVGAAVAITVYDNM